MSLSVATQPLLCLSKSSSSAPTSRYNLFSLTSSFLLRRRIREFVDHCGYADKSILLGQGVRRVRRGRLGIVDELQFLTSLGGDSRRYRDALSVDSIGLVEGRSYRSPTAAIRLRSCGSPFVSVSV